MSSRRKHGGSRPGSGRKLRSQTLGPPQANSLTNYFNTNNANATPPVPTPPVPINRPIRNSQTAARDAYITEVREAERAREADPVQIRVRDNIPNRPNVNAEEVFDESIYMNGKSVKSSKNLKIQIQHIMSTHFYSSMYSNIEDKGKLWWHPPDLVKTPTHHICERWLDFFKLRVYNWIPEAMIEGGWRPNCPNCKNKLSKNGNGAEPRLVFDFHENYWLNAPHKYICTICEKDNVNKSYNFRSTSPEIMEQLKMTHPEIWELFPCYLTSKNALDKKLLNSMIQHAVKGIGPSAFRETIVLLHELQWQHKENLWGKHVLDKLNNSVLYRTMDRTTIEKCPEYFSEALGGCVPSGRYLVHVFCEALSKKRNYFDSECIKRAKTTKVLAIDASYKVPKWMMKWGAERIYDALHSGTNEYNEIVLQRFSTSDNHAELGDNLEQLHSLGLSPYLVFSDDPIRDESLVKEKFPRLQNHDNDLVVEENPEDLAEMSTDKDILYLHRYNEALDTLMRFRNDLEAALSAGNTAVKVCFDVEWPVFFEKEGNINKKRNGNINLLQLGANVTNYTLILELYNFVDNATHMNAIAQKLRAIFSLQVSCFTGCRQKSDYTMLQKQYSMFNFPKETYKLMDDVSIMAINRGLTTRGKGQATLQALCRGQGRFLPKPEHVRLGTCFNSKRGSLSQEALRYCQLDVEAPLILHSLYMAWPDLTERMKNSAIVEVGSTVDIMPSATSISTIAQGTIHQIGPHTWGDNARLTIRRDQVLIKVTKVFNVKGIIHYPCDGATSTKCECGRKVHGRIQDKCSFYLYGQYGPPPFLVLEMKSRLRKCNDLITYPPCQYSDEGRGDAPFLDNLMNPEPVIETTLNEIDDDDNTSVQSIDSTSDEESTNDEDGVPGLTPDTIELVDRTNENENDMDEYSVYNINDDDDEPTEAQLRAATDTALNDILMKIIEDADKLAETEVENARLLQQDEDNDLQVDKIPDSVKYKTVLGDIFHFMDRAKVPTHHEFKGLFFRALRAAVYIMHKGDVDDVKTVLESKGVSWEKKMAFDFTYISQRVRRKVPNPDVLYYRLKAVFDFFNDKKDTTTGTTLLSEKNKKKFRNMLETVKLGYASDPPHMRMYIQKTDKFGRPAVDRDGLVLYRSLRGTSNLESLHQYLTTSFGHSVAGPMYSDVLLTVVRHCYNWRMSRKNRPGFPQIMHYEGELIDRTNTLYESLFGFPKYRNWQTFNESLPFSSVYDIVPVNKKHTSLVNLNDEFLSKQATLAKMRI